MHPLGYRHNERWRCAVTDVVAQVEREKRGPAHDESSDHHTKGFGCFQLHGQREPPGLSIYVQVNLFCLISGGFEDVQISIENDYHRNCVIEHHHQQRVQFPVPELEGERSDDNRVQPDGGEDHNSSLCGHANVVVQRTRDAKITVNTDTCQVPYRCHADHHVSAGP